MRLVAIPKESEQAQIIPPNRELSFQLKPRRNCVWHKLILETVVSRHVYEIFIRAGKTRYVDFDECTRTEPGTLDRCYSRMGNEYAIVAPIAVGEAAVCTIRNLDLTPIQVRAYFIIDEANPRISEGEITCNSKSHGRKSP